ncbi:hypothetical protein [Streptomyces sp. NPDC058486]|uniref:hypothetical protein n=1 Tax=unclassified Streptomyces TaxID=2593676 RepID=UPI003650325C
MTEEQSDPLSRAPLRLTLTPLVGVSGMRLGMSVEQAVAAARAVGLVASGDDGGDAPGQVLCRHAGSDTRVGLGFVKGALVNIELYRFWVEDADVRVVLDGLDVFRTPGDELLERLAELGHRVELNDDDVDMLPDLKVILANESSYDFPVDDEGFPLCFDYVLLTSVLFHGPRGD